MIDLAVQYIAQSYDFDCWHASLRMVYKFRHGNGAEPPGLLRVEQEGLARYNERAAVMRAAREQGRNYAWTRRCLRDLPKRGLHLHEFEELAGAHGMVAPLMPLSCNEVQQSGGWTADRLEALLRIHGPIWCAFDYGHIVVLKGVTQDGLLIHDPQGSADTPYAIENFNRLLSWGPFCLMYMPGQPNPGKD